jgi:hypothetical protein
VSDRQSILALRDGPVMHPTIKSLAMNNLSCPFPVRSGVVPILLTGILACVPAGADPFQDQPVDVSGTEFIDSNEGEAASSTNSLQADFNGDGHADLAIGVPNEASSGALVGSVNVLYGSVNGLTPTGEQVWLQDSPGVLGEAGPDDGFGLALAAGDFNGDDYADLAIAAPFDDVDSDNDAGSVNVLYGSASGLTTTGNQLWHQNSPGILGEAGRFDHFGLALTSGNFDGDRYLDLAIGVPMEDLESKDNGMVHVIHGSSAGLTEVGDQIWHQDSPGVEGLAEDSDTLGSALAAGDFDRDGRDDLAIGAPGEDVGDLDDAGAVNVLYGSSGGLGASGDQIWHQDIVGVEGHAETFDGFGEILAVGDFDGDGFDDLGVGVPSEDVANHSDAGVVNTIYGSSSGLTESGDQYWHQSQGSLDGVADPLDRFGESITVGDFDGDGRDDLAVGLPGEDLGTIEDAGLVQILYGSNLGLLPGGQQSWHQNTAGVEGVAEAFDRLGSSLSVGDFDGDGAADLAVGVPFESVGTVEAAGAVNVIYGTAAGLAVAGDQVWHQDIQGLSALAESSDLFGAAIR